MLLTVSAKASSLCGPFNIGLTKSLLFWAIGQNAQINLVTCTNCELMAESKYGQIVPIPFLVLGKFSVTNVQLKSLQFGMVFREMRFCSLLFLV